MTGERASANGILNAAKDALATMGLVLPGHSKGKPRKTDSRLLIAILLN